MSLVTNCSVYKCTVPFLWLFSQMRVQALLFKRHCTEIDKISQDFLLTLRPGAIPNKFKEGKEWKRVRKTFNLSKTSQSCNKRYWRNIRKEVQAGRPHQHLGALNIWASFITLFVLYPHCNMTRYMQFSSFSQEKLIRRMLFYDKAILFITTSEKTQLAACGDHSYLSVAFLEAVLLLPFSLLNLSKERKKMCETVI